jgi:hypothetical protein
VGLRRAEYRSAGKWKLGGFCTCWRHQQLARSGHQNGSRCEAANCRARNAVAPGARTLHELALKAVSLHPTALGTACSRCAQRGHSTTSPHPCHLTAYADSACMLLLPFPSSSSSLPPHMLFPTTRGPPSPCMHCLWPPPTPFSRAVQAWDCKHQVSFVCIFTIHIITLNDPWLYHAVLSDSASRPLVLMMCLAAAPWAGTTSISLHPSGAPRPLGALLTARELLSRPLGAGGLRGSGRSSTSSSSALRHTEPHAVRLWQQVEGQQLDACITAFVAAADNTERR